MFDKKAEIHVVAIAVLFAALTSIGCQSAKRVAAEDAAPPVKIEKTAAPQAQKIDNADEITIAAVGDVMLASTFPDDSRMPPNDGADLLKDATPILTSADIAFGNLEGPLLEGGTSAKCPHYKPQTSVNNSTANASSVSVPTPETTENAAQTAAPSAAPKPAAKAAQPVRCFAFRVPTRYGKYLKTAGFDVLSLANNHAADFGDNGRVSTRKVLDDLGIKHAGSDKSARFSTVVVEAKNKKIAFVGFAHNNVSLNVNDLAAARQAVEAAAKRADIVVASFHGGAEGAGAQRVPNQTEIFFGEQRGDLRRFARTVIDAGADLVLGHGPHVLRGMETYKDRLVVYSMGNFATYGWFSLKGATAETMILELKLQPDGKFLSGKINSFKLEGRGTPVADKSKSAVATVRNLSQLDFGANAAKIRDDGSF